MNTYIKLLLSAPRSIWFNLCYLPLRQAVKMPVLMVYNASINIKGRFVIDSDTVHTGMIRFGTHEADACEPNDTAKIVILKGGKLVFKGTAHVGHGTKIHVNPDAEIVLGDNFAVSSSSKFISCKRMAFGKDVQFSWGCQVMDSDTHTIVGVDGSRINPDKEVKVGNKVWIGSNAIIMKGAVVPNNCVIGANSFVSGKKFEPNTIIVGSPAKSVKEIKGWEL